MSGIGFASRRYLDPKSPQPQQKAHAHVLVNVLDQSNISSDPRVMSAKETLKSEPEVAKWAAFVVKDVAAQIADERRRWGAVKRMKRTESGLLVTEEVISLYDPLYIAFVINAIKHLSAHKDRYLNAQQQLNLEVEQLLVDYVKTGKTKSILNVLKLGETVHHINDHDAQWLNANPAMSTVNRSY